MKNWIIAGIVAIVFTGCIPNPARMSGSHSAEDNYSIDNINSDYSEPATINSDSLAYELALHTLLEASNLLIAADSMIVAGDTLSAENNIVEAIVTVGNNIGDFTLLDRLAAVDSIAAWSICYSQIFGGEYCEVEPGVEGIAAIDDFPEYGDSLMMEDDTLFSDMEMDTTYVLDEYATIVHYDILPSIPDTLNSRVQNYIDYFTGSSRGRGAMETWMSRSENMVPRMRRILRSQGVPEDLVYLAMVESGFSTRARSYARAVGPWQFIYSTGVRFDLEADWWYDERRDVERSTVAAARYLRELYEHLGDWYLATAAYNCGEGRVRREIRRYNSNDYWRFRRLPRQTRGYVPIFLAARKIMLDPVSYGFTPPEYERVQPRDSVIITECVELRALAEALEIELDTLKAMNPALIRWCTPPNRDTTIVYLPFGKAEGFAEVYASIPDEEKTSWVRHLVRSGESLSEIAERYHTSMRAIMDVPANRISDPNRIGVNQHILVPVPAEGANVDFSHVSRAEDPDAPTGMERRYHTVRRGDTLSEIAERYHVGLSRLLRWNNLNQRSIIRPGQRLVVYQPRVENAGQVTQQEDGTQVYTVQRGDSPWLIAQRFRVDLNELLRINNLNSNSSIHPGDRIVIPSQEVSVQSEVLYHTIRQGDTLWDISEMYGVSVNDIQRWNQDINPAELVVGRQIEIRRGS